MENAKKKYEGPEAVSTVWFKKSKSGKLYREFNDNGKSYIQFVKLVGESAVISTFDKAVLESYKEAQKGKVDNA